ncbi:hypothetical protein ACFSLT_00195 [Novosphingobium resinovorum]
MLKGAGIAAGIAASLLASSAQAQYGPGWGGGMGGGWDRPGWGGSMLDSPRMQTRSKDSREGHVEVSRFVSPDAAAVAELGHGPVSVESESGDGAWVEARGAPTRPRSSMLWSAPGTTRSIPTRRSRRLPSCVSPVRCSPRPRKSAARSAAPPLWKWALTGRPMAWASTST